MRMETPVLSRGGFDGVQERTVAPPSRPVTRLDEPRQRGTHRLEHAYLPVHLADPDAGKRFHGAAITPSARGKLEELTDIGEGEPQGLSMADEPHHPDGLVRIITVAGSPPPRLTQEPEPLVVAQRRHRHPRRGRQSANRHCADLVPCTEVQGQAGGDKRVACRACECTGSVVREVTLNALLRPAALARRREDRHRFCATPSCPVVYFGREERFARDDVTVPVFQKETGTARPVCYCFAVSDSDIREEIRRTGGSTASRRIRALVRNGSCACETRNPKGACCLGDVAAIERSERGGDSIAGQD